MNRVPENLVGVCDLSNELSCIHDSADLNRLPRESPANSPYGRLRRASDR